MYSRRSIHRHTSMYRRGAPMSRLQLALNVPDIDAAVDHYSKLFATAPTKRKPGYANFAIADPPLKLVLFENAGADSRLNHLGIEVMSTGEVAAHQARLTGAGVETVQENGTCCFANQEKVWVDGPDGAWEIYTVLEDADEFGDASAHVDDEGDSLCCTSVPEAQARCC